MNEFQNYKLRIHSKFIIHNSYYLASKKENRSRKTKDNSAGQR